MAWTIIARRISLKTTENDWHALQTRASGVDSKTMYMFVVKEINGKRGELLGDMPLSSQFGYLAASNDVTLAAKTIAHELGHGMFYLRHTFSQYNFEEGSTDNLMDYKPEGTQLFKKQWDEIFDPRRPWFAWRQDEEEGAIITISKHFDKEDLKKYNEFVNGLLPLSLFSTIYNYVDNSDKYVLVSSLVIYLNNLAEIKRRHRYSNGYFLNAEKQERFWGLIKYDSGTEFNPHKIVLFSSKNYELSGGKIKGDGFKRASTVFEEFFHAAHYLYLEINGGVGNEIEFLTQTETEVELAQAFAYYLMNNDEKFNNVNTPYFDSYGIARVGETSKINTAVSNIFDIIIEEKELSDNTISELKNSITFAIAKKQNSSAYSEMDLSLINWDFKFLKFLIKESYK